MSITNNKIKNIIKESLKIESDQINESLVAPVKTYNLSTEFQSPSTKSTHIKLYQQYLETFNRVSAELDTADRSSANSNDSQYRSLKVDETFNMNAVYLHEMYFANISDVASNIAMDSLTYMRLARDFGGFDKWQVDFIACCMSARCGWAVTYYNVYTQTYMNTFIDLHSSNVPIGCIPIIVMDVWQHAYFRDYLDDVKTYTYAMMKEFNWSVIEERVKKSEKIAQASRAAL